MTIKLLHFADAHIDMVTQGKLDPESGLPVRVTDFLAALDQIVDRAIEERVDLVVFAGDAYKDRTPQPTYQREWGKRMIRLSEAGIPTILLVGNHDVSRAAGRAHTLHEYRTLNVPHIHVADKIDLLGPDELGIQAQILTMPWVSPSVLFTREDTAGLSLDEVYDRVKDHLDRAIEMLIERADPDLPLILTAHASVIGAKYGSERGVMLGREIVLSHGMVRREGLDYVALGHIHQHQELNGGAHPPIVYPGSIERIDFGEMGETKGFVLAEVGKGKSDWHFEPLSTRPFIDFEPDLPRSDTLMANLMNQLPDADKVEGAVARVRLNLPREWEPLLDETEIQKRFEKALSLQIVKNWQVENRSRLGQTAKVEQMTALELLDAYWHTKDFSIDEIGKLNALAEEIFSEIELD